VNGKVIRKADFMKKESCHPLFFDHIACRYPEYRNACNSLDTEIERCADPEKTYISSPCQQGMPLGNHITNSLTPVIRKRAFPPISLFSRNGDEELGQDSTTMN
jgi:hypothetical protein